MTTIVDLRVPAAGTVMGGVFESAPSATCEMEQVIASDGYRMWIDGTERSTVESALESSRSVAAYELVLTGDGRWLYDVEFTSDVVDVFDLVAEEQGTVVTASATNGTWQLQVRFCDREYVSRVYDRLLEHDVTTDLARLTDLDGESVSSHGLTPKQYETLVAAHERGYFTIPRETSMEELADELGVSHQALSERLRRAYRALVDTELNGTDTPQLSPSHS